MKLLKSFAILVVSSYLLFGCKINQTKHKEKQGRWIYTDTINNVIYRNTGKYKNGLEKNTWKYYKGNRLTKKEKYKNGICKVTNYFDNGNIASQGNTKMSITDSVTHWHYTGKWNFFNDSGKLIRLKTYEENELQNDSVIAN